MKKNIFYFTPNLPPENNAASIRNAWFLKALKSSLYEIHIVTGSDLKFTLPKNTEKSVTRLWKELLSGVCLFFKVLFSRHDLYFFSSPPFITILIGSLACRLTNKNYMLDIRDLYPEVLLELGLINKRALAYKILLAQTKSMYKRSIAIITVTNSLKERILNHSPKANLHVIYNGFDSEIFKPGNQKFDHFTVVFHGNLGRFQRIDLIVKVANEMFRTHPDIQFKIIGQGPGARFLKDNCLNIEYLGPKSHEFIANYIQKCHVGLSLRTDDDISREAFPVKMFEYFGSGIPTIISPQGEAANFLIKHQLGFCVKNNTQDIIETILKVKNSHLHVEPDINYSRQTQSQRLSKLIDLLFQLP